jgi:hypothetical protein
MRSAKLKAEPKKITKKEELIEKQGPQEGFWSSQRNQLRAEKGRQG